MSNATLTKGFNSIGKSGHCQAEVLIKRRPRAKAYRASKRTYRFSDPRCACGNPMYPSQSVCDACTMTEPEGAGDWDDDAVFRKWNS